MGCIPSHTQRDQQSLAKRANLTYSLGPEGPEHLVRSALSPTRQLSLVTCKRLPNPTDRVKAGSKHHVIADARGVPLAASLTGANAPDVTQALPLV